MTFMKGISSLLNDTSRGHWAAFLSIREVVPIMKRQEYGRIVNVPPGSERIYKDSNTVLQRLECLVFATYG